MMKGPRSVSAYLFLLMSLVVGPASILALVTTPALADTDDWTRVSAPPPPGPYRAVNLDPRIPGQGGSPVAGNVPGVQQVPGNIFPEPAAPAAGRPSNNQAPMKQLPPQVPGVYQARMPRPSFNAYPGPSGYPVPMGRHYSGTPPHRYFPSQPGQPEPVVPPPPVYDAMMRAPPGAYNSAGRR